MGEKWNKPPPSEETRLKLSESLLRKRWTEHKSRELRLNNVPGYLRGWGPITRPPFPGGEGA